MNDALVGSVLDGRYRVVERIGAGGMGVVYRAEQVNVLGRDVAIKLVLGAALDEPGARRFENEAIIIARLRHPNTLKLLDSGKLDDGRRYIVTEFLAGESLDSMLKTGRMRVRTAVAILEQIADSIAEAHAHAIIHRDLKPSNIIIERIAGKNVVKVLDFGLAK